MCEALRRVARVIIVMGTRMRLAGLDGWTVWPLIAIVFITYALRALWMDAWYLVRVRVLCVFFFGREFRVGGKGDGLCCALEWRLESRRWQCVAVALLGGWQISIKQSRAYISRVRFRPFSPSHFRGEVGGGGGAGPIAMMSVHIAATQYHSIHYTHTKYTFLPFLYVYMCLYIYVCYI